MFLIYAIACFFHVFLLQQPQAAVPKQPSVQKQSQTLLEWLYAKLGIDPRVYARITRGYTTTAQGRYLVVFDAASEIEKVVADCDPCWSPTLIGQNHIGYLRPDGIWSIELSENKKPVLVFSAKNLRIILGLAPHQDKELLVVQENAAGSACPFSVEVVDLTAHTSKRPAKLPPDCMTSLAGVVRSGEIQGDKRIKADPDQKDILFTADLLPSSGGPEYVRFDEKIRSDQDGSNRFDPVWLDKTRIAYIKSDPQ